MRTGAVSRLDILIWFKNVYRNSPAVHIRVSVKDNADIGVPLYMSTFKTINI